MASFQDCSTITANDDRLYTFSVTEDWLQGRTAFGGLSAGAAVRAMLEHVPHERKLRSLMVSFVAPVKEGEAQVLVSILRSGRALHQVEARVMQEEQVCLVLLGSFGAAHDKYLPMEPPSAPVLPAPEDALPMPFIPGVTPNFTQHLEYQWTVDSIPFSGSQEAHCQGWVRFKEGAPVGWPELVGLLDSWPPPIISTADGFVPASSVTWMINVFAEVPVDGFAGTDWWMYDAECSVSKDGYADTQGQLWDQSGRLIARSRQLAVEFSK